MKLSTQYNTTHASKKVCFSELYMRTHVPKNNFPKTTSTPHTNFSIGCLGPEWCYHKASLRTHVATRTTVDRGHIPNSLMEHKAQLAVTKYNNIPPAGPMWYLSRASPIQQFWVNGLQFYLVFRPTPGREPRWSLCWSGDTTGNSRSSSFQKRDSKASRVRCKSGPKDCWGLLLSSPVCRIKDMFYI